MNWGKAIIMTFVLFAGFIGGLVFWMSRQRVDLVRDDYYQDEITYQRQIDRISNTRQHPQRRLVMTYQPEKQQVVFVLPDSLRKGDITFYRPADRRQDFRVHIRPEHPLRQVVSTARLDRGYWRVQFTWSDGQRDYYLENDLFL